MEWKSLKTELPEDRQYVIVHPPYISCAFPDEPRHVMRWCGRLGTFRYYLGDSIHTPTETITHWMPLPEPPDETESSGIDEKCECGNKDELRKHQNKCKHVNKKKIPGDDYYWHDYFCPVCLKRWAND
jgi:hypothetical protein